MKDLVKDLLEKEENLWLEFKSFWYWNQNDEQFVKGWGEFLKDFSALFNTYTLSRDIKYFIIGFDEVTKKTQNYHIDQNGETIKVFNNLDDFKSRLVKKLCSYFCNIPEYMSRNNLYQIETLFALHEVVIESAKLLVIEIRPAPYLLELKQVLQGNEQFKEGNILTRLLKSDGSPENINSNDDIRTKLKEIVASIKLHNYPNKDLSIYKVVELFKLKNFPLANIERTHALNNYSEGLHFEFYRLRGEYNVPINFVYYSSYTTQRKTFEYLKDNNILDPKTQTIVLTEQLNKKKGVIDKSRIEKIFKRYIDNIEVYYLEEFALKKLYSDLFDPDIFHQGSFNIKNFVKPYTNLSDEKTADLLLKEWYKNKQDPILIMKGTGGIGKTTVLKYFLDYLYKREKVNILFINSHELINDIMRNPSIEDIFDFYQIIAQKYNITKQFDKKMLELSIDNGSLVIALDGIDEVIEKVGRNFNIQNFINAIFTNYSEHLEKTKVLITCRDYFWDKTSFDYEISTMDLEPFDDKLAETYFTIHFKEKNGKVRKAMDLAEEFALNEKTYIPYILDMIAENLLDDMVSSNLKSDVLFPKDIINDYLVGKVCEREITKLENLEIDTQIHVFMFMAAEFNGVLHKDQFKKIPEQIKETIGKKNIVQTFQAHPLLFFDKNTDILKFRYDFFNDYFKNIYLALFLISLNFDKINITIIEILIQHITYDNSFVKLLIFRLNVIGQDKLKEAIWAFLAGDLGKIDYIDSNKKRQLASSLFTLQLAMNKSFSVEQRTDLLKELFETKANHIENLSLINLHTNGRNKPIFDFSGLKFSNCFFENYEYFCECRFDENTYFSDTEFIAPLFRDGIKPKINFKNIDTSTCVTQGIIEILKKEEISQKTKDSKTRCDLLKIIKFFWSNSCFRQKLASDANKRLRMCSNVLNILLNEKIILKTTVTTSQKRADPAYFINPIYSDLRKVMEENKTCSDFERIMKKIQ